MPHVRQHPWLLAKGRSAVGRAVEDAAIIILLCDGVDAPIEPKATKVKILDGRCRLLWAEIDAIRRMRQVRPLLATLTRRVAVKVHADSALRGLDVHIGRGDVAAAVRHAAHRKNVRWMNRPWTCGGICVRDAHVLSRVRGKVHEVTAWQIACRQPRWALDHRRTNNIAPCDAPGGAIDQRVVQLEPL